MTVHESPRTTTWRITTGLMRHADAARTATTVHQRRDLLIGAAAELRLRRERLEAGDFLLRDLDVLCIEADDAGLIPTGDQSVADALEQIQNHGKETLVGLRVLVGALVRDAEGSAGSGAGVLEARTTIGFSREVGPEPDRVSLDTGALARILDLEAARVDEPGDPRPGDGPR